LWSVRVAGVRTPPGPYRGASAIGPLCAGFATGRAGHWPNFVALALSVVLLSLGGVFTFVLAKTPAAPTVLRVGEPAPDFTLPDASGAPVSLDSFRERTPVVLVFYRGYW